MNTIFNEYDVVRAVRVLEGVVPLGALGTILMVFGGSSPEYLVEFLAESGETIGVLIVQGGDLEFVDQS